MLDVVAGLAIIGVALAVLALGVFGGAWAMLMIVKGLPLIGRRHRHGRWDVSQRGEPAIIGIDEFPVRKEES